MSKLHFAAITLLIVIFIGCTSNQEEKDSIQKPNIVFIITDDQGYGDISLHGNTLLQTPNIDSIGIKGTRLDRFYVSPVCAPTRAAVLTGRRAMSTGAYGVTRGAEVMDASEYTMAELLKDNGYQTACIGKWHNGSYGPYHPKQQGFDHFFGFTAGHWNNYFDPILEVDGKMEQQKGYIADVFTDHAIEYIKSKKEAPFFCYLAYNTPHSPFQLPDEYFKMYEGKTDGKDEDHKKRNAAVYGMVKNIDDNIGRIQKTLKELNIDDNTIIVFMTDNGPNTHRYNGNMKGKKAQVNDGGVRVPFFIQWNKQIPSGKILTTSTAHIDILPTFMSLLDLEYKGTKELHGIDLSNRIMGQDVEEDRMIFSHVNYWTDIREAPGAVRTKDWRMTFYWDGPELTKISDISEEKNLTTENQELADSLRAQYDAWFSEVKNHQIPAIPVGYDPSISIAAHDGYITGNTKYKWSKKGYSNEWVHNLGEDSSFLYWVVDVQKPGKYNAKITYTSKEDASILLKYSDQSTLVEVEKFIPVSEGNRSVVERQIEAIGQSWNTSKSFEIELKNKRDTIFVGASDSHIEVLNVILVRDTTSYIED